MNPNRTAPFPLGAVCVFEIVLQPLYVRKYNLLHIYHFSQDRAYIQEVKKRVILYMHPIKNGWGLKTHFEKEIV